MKLENIRYWLKYRVFYFFAKDWQIVLEMMYTHEFFSEFEERGTASRTYGERVDETIKRLSIIATTGLSEDEFEQALELLKSAGYVEEPEEGHGITFGLSEKGFRAAHNRKLERQQQRNNRLVALLTVVLVLIEIWNPAVRIFESIPYI